MLFSPARLGTRVTLSAAASVAIGKVIVFDDMYSHEVWNDSEEDRVAGVVDRTVGT